MSLSLMIELGWKSALIAGAALLLTILLRSRSAADRAAVLRLAVALLLLLPLVAIAFPALQIETSAALDPAPAPLPSSAYIPATVSSPSPAVALVEAGSWLWSDLQTMALLAYFAGFAALALRLAAGLVTLGRWTRSARPVQASEWTSALERIAAGRPAPRLLVCEDVPAPLSWGWRRPIILIDEDTHDRAEDADAVLAHEMAHVARRDWLALILARLTVALFWFNPLVWLLAREVAQQAEEAADSQALRRVDPARYAQTLVACAQGLSVARLPANSIAASGGGLGRRVKAILEGKSRASGSRWTRIAMIGCIGFAAPVAALELIPAPPPAPKAPAAPLPPKAPAAPAALPIPFAAMQALPPVPEAPEAPEAPDALEASEPPEPPEYHEEMVAIDIDEEAIARAAERAGRDAERAARLAVRDAQRVAAQAGRDARRIRIDSARIAAEAERAAAAGLAAGAQGMREGALNMERGAREMEEAARNLQNRDYREKQIADAARRGRTVTHQQLIDSIPELREGAEGLRRGAVEMREAAEEMRRRPS